MRVAHIITRFIIGGVQENTLLTCVGLRRDFGDDVLLITGPTHGPEGSLMDRVDAYGVPYHMVPSLIRRIDPVRDTIAYRHLRKALRSFQPDVVHTHSAKAGILGRAAAWSLGVRAVIHGVHGAPFYPYQNPLTRELYRRCECWAARRCHAMISVADAMTDLLVEAKVAPRERFTTIYSGMEVEPLLYAHEHRETVRREWNVGPEHVVVGKIARLFHLKGHEYVIDAARQIIDAVPNVRFVFVGDGLLADAIRGDVQRRGLGSHFIFTGLVPPCEIPRLIGGMDLLVHTSLREGLARVLPQALIAGKPVVSYDIDGAREVVLDGETGFLLEPKAVTELAEAVIRLARDESLRRRMGRNGRRRFTDVFRHQTMTRRIRGLYQRVLRGDDDNGRGM